MTHPFVESYVAHEQTLAILPKRHIDYQSSVIEMERTLFVRETPFETIKHSCMKHWASYEGRRAATLAHTNYRQRVPIAIEPSRKIFAFPTHSPTRFECCWLFHHPYIRIGNRDNGSFIQLKNGEKLELDISLHTLREQIQRTTLAAELAYVCVK